jgi:SAM-dependent methyltransferase
VASPSAAVVYDLIHAARGKDYDRESEVLRALIEDERPGARTLLDVACGTGQHLARLRRSFRVEGVDLDPVMLAAARERLGPDLPLREGDMRDLDLGRRFDAVICLFSAIGYVVTLDGLRRAVAAMARHLTPGGVLLIEPWMPPGTFTTRRIHAQVVEQPELKIVRMSRVREARNRRCTMDFDILIGTPDGTERRKERHMLGLFADAEYQAAFRAAGLMVRHDAELMPESRGLYVGRAPA